MFISRRMLIIIGVVGVIILGGLGFVFALLLSQANASSTAATPTPTVVATIPNPTTANHVCASGVIQSVGAQSFVISATKAKKTVTITIAVNAQTIYRKNGVPGFSFTGLAPGQHVRIIAQGICDPSASTITAQRVTVVVSAITPTPTISPSPTA
jgi:hypothetical protein